MKEAPFHYILALPEYGFTEPKFEAHTIDEIKAMGAQQQSGHKTFIDESTVGQDGRIFDETCEHWTLNGDYLWVTVRGFPNRQWFKPRN